ncbi:hypothetical protein F9L00_21010 [Brucella anthropi]|jgi:hypothetical protein|uniref:Uncharacterized protein n=1 Tax=Pseudochelatococcus contaminans TaxID=1538103 RepID=A0A7W5Z7W9_9HYPH|nr:MULTISPECIES: hypothetical protein [Hyphomicrobiales]KAB2756328.1 hypothetical protein F9K98_24115 [Brucella anthropi]KAB2774345.1 hypothetical protein F9L00_21010 [Brucella anthropi]MBB3811485.1 hypothetical protein [Pseudochelatococcus contaminans]MCQ9148103.1 hypothetical protein [Ochrobactrum sp. BTU2]UGQ22946.1 hypothetical protein LRL11_20710 [Brucella anthropi]|eukprot:jgi/Tetstr1/451733/TSEL_038769.t1
MPKFVVSKVHDAFVYYDAVVEADTFEDALDLAYSPHFKGDWCATGYVQEFEDYIIDENSGVRVLKDGETVEAFLSIAVTAQEHDAVLTGLWLLQFALVRGPVEPLLRNTFTNGGAHSGLDLTEIDALCERIDG